MTAITSIAARARDYLLGSTLTLTPVRGRPLTGWKMKSNGAHE